ncbi:DUF3867 domain-containing protein [Clostridium tyrobutyricum]|uniref:DUF3867 domain-containing protein n=1 Tax=Clostridium tyrobutyricum TaxID=1519 RepID=UPI001C387C42|nr:DUF3867 domain-containing protein [Clostridium tyrobutyricum]MBV4419169.1 DUF3867 domain-containing protein [Clostridium tyrobutyricum]
MSDKKDEKIVNFSELKNKAREKDIQKIEDYVYGLCYDMSQGKISMADFSKNIQDYMEKNNISQEKMFNIQKELMKKYGIDMDDIENQMKSMGLNLPSINKDNDYETVRKAMSFHEKYKSGIGNVIFTTYSISNSLNNIKIYINEETVMIRSRGQIDLEDLELNDFLCSYKKVMKDKSLKIVLCEKAGTFEY